MREDNNPVLTEQRLRWVWLSFMNIPGLKHIGGKDIFSKITVVAKGETDIKSVSSHLKLGPLKRQGFGEIL